jgi:MSHA biogenesis protein MshI
MFSFKENSKNETSAGITLSNEGIALAIIDHKTPSPTLTFCQFISCAPSEQTKQLDQLVKQHKLDSIPCNFVLLPHEYQLIQVDAPEVTQEELSAALHWQVKDLIDFHIDDAVIDHISLPNESASGKRQLLAVVSRKSVIRAYVEQLNSVNCHIHSIDIAIQAARNIIHKQTSDSQPESIGLLNLWDDIAKISVILNHDIYINRTSTIGLQSLGFVDDNDLNSQLILDSLALELQRTFDYYESHSRQAAISQLYIMTNGSQTIPLADMLEQRLGISCFNIAITKSVATTDKVGKIDSKCITAVGGALRGSE